MARSITARLEALERGPITGVRADIMELRYDACYKAVVEQNAELARLRAKAKRAERIEELVVELFDSDIHRGFEEWWFPDETAKELRDLVTKEQD